MNFLEERIQKDGVVKEGNVLKVDSFLNHQMDIELFEKMGEEWKSRFAGKPINKVVTIEASGMELRVLLLNILERRLFLPRNQKASILMVICMWQKWSHLLINAKIR